MKYTLPRIQEFVSFAIKKATKECIRVRTIHPSVLNFKAYLQTQTLISIGYSSPSTLREIPAFTHKNTQSSVQNFSRIDVYVMKRIRSYSNAILRLTNNKLL